jgi:hypothetical protein
MANTFPKAGGAFRTPGHVYAKSGGVWRDCTKVHVRSGGVWRQTFASGGGVPALTDHTEGGTSISAQFLNNGSLNFHDSDGPIDRPSSGQWLTTSPVASTITALYDVMFTYVSGPNPSTGNSKSGIVNKGGDAYATWLNLASTRFISLSAIPGTLSGSAGGTLVFDVAIRPAGGGSNLATCRVTLQASAG